MPPASIVAWAVSTSLKPVFGCVTFGREPFGCHWCGAAGGGKMRCSDLISIIKNSFIASAGFLLRVTAALRALFMLWHRHPAAGGGKKEDLGIHRISCRHIPA
jgi:hypothetical protein